MPSLTSLPYPPLAAETGDAASHDLIVTRHRVMPTAQGVVFPRLVRYRGGTYSPTVHRIRFADGTSARTDFVRLNPGIRAYSIDLNGKVAATPVNYHARSWSGAGNLSTRFRAEAVGRVLAASYPVVGLGALTEHLRRAGWPVGTGHLREHEAIAATQAVLWKLSNDVDLDTTALNAPESVTARVGGQSPPLPVDHGERGLALTAAVPAGDTLTLDLEFAQSPVVSTVTFESVGDRPADLRLRLLRYRDGGWSEIAGTRSSIAADGTSRLRAPDLGAVSGHTPAGHSRGYRRYRLEFTGNGAVIGFRNLAVQLSGTPAFVNGANVVYLYRHLLTIADGYDEIPGPDDPTPAIDALDARATGGALGPFRLRGDRPAWVQWSIRGDGRTCGGRIGPLAPGESFVIPATTARLDHGAELVMTAASERSTTIEPRVLLPASTVAGAERLTPLITPVSSRRETVAELTALIAPRHELSAARAPLFSV